MFLITLAAACSGIVIAADDAAGKLKLEDGLHVVEFDAARGEFSIQHKASGKVFAKSGRFENSGGKAELADVPDTTFGTARGIRITYPTGNTDEIALYPNLPFVVFHSSRHNAAAEPVVHAKIQVLSAAIETGAALEAVKTLGSGGLRGPAENPGSYGFLAIVDPATRGGAVGGWVTHDRASGVVFSPVADGSVRLQARADYGRLRIKPGADAKLETFVLGWFDDARLGLETYADAIAKVYHVKLHPQTPGFCSWYMEKHGGACDEKHLAELSAVAAKELKPYGYDFIMIDDGWQLGIKANGPKKNFTDHAPQGPYPSGMKPTAEMIKSLGLTPAIWFMPFAGTYKDPFFEKHQDWFAKTVDGKPYETAWGGTCLDMTNPDTQAYLRSIVKRIGGEWGYRIFKMDGFWTGSATKQIYVNDGYKEDNIGDAVFSDPDKTNVEALRDGAKLIREAAGPDVFLLGCCLSQNMRSFSGSLGLLDAMRVGPDTGGNIGSPHGSRLWFLNGRVWWNDPDCVFVRSSMHIDRARLNAAWAAISGQLFYTSDWMPETPAERMEIIKRCIPSHSAQSRPVDVFESNIARIWLLTDTRETARRDVVAFYNWDKKAEEVSATAQRIGLPPAKEYVGFDFWANTFVAPFREKLSATLPPQACRILAVRPVSDVPQVLSTSRHVTQGIVDLRGEKWDAASATLSGISSVVQNDPYELRIVVPVAEKSWRVVAVNVSAEDNGAGAKASYTQDGPKIRATLTSATNRDVKWSVRFESAKVEVTPPAAVKQLQASASFSGVRLSWTPNGAEGYRIERNDGVVFDVTEPSLLDPNVKNGVAYRYKVVALGWGGTVSPEASVEVTPKTPQRPPLPPAPTVHLSDLTPLHIQNGWGKGEMNKSIAGKKLQIDGKTYEKGIGAHAPAVWVYKIPAGASRFVAVVGLDDEVKTDARASVAFQVFGDVKEMGEQPVLIAESPPLSDASFRSWSIDVELNTRFKELRLVVTDAGDGNKGDHADWVNVGFVTR